MAWMGYERQKLMMKKSQPVKNLKARCSGYEYICGGNVGITQKIILIV